MDPSNRLQLNFGNNDRNMQFSDRAYPTTPSTFPQPVFQGQGAQDGYGQQQASNGYGGGTNGGGGAGGYFNNNSNPYSPGFPPQQQVQQPQQGYQQGFQAPQPSYQPRQPGYNDGPNGLAQQLSHQHLGNAPRPPAAYPPQAPPSQRPRATGPPEHNQPRTPLLPLAPNAAVQQSSKADLPEKAAEPYIGLNSKQNAILTGEYVSNFFKQNVGRARDRNER